MKSNRINRFLGFLRRFFSASAIVMSFFGSAHAGNLYWDGGTADVVGAADGTSTGGAGTWDVTIKNWDDAANHVAWVNANADAAIFGGAAGGVVTLGAPVTANALTFSTAGYTLSGASALTLGGTTPTITANVDATIASVVGTGAVTLAKAGAGQLTLTGVNTYTGATTVNGGTLRLGDGTTNPTINSTYSIASGATLKLDYGAGGGAAPTWSKYSGAGTLTLNSGKNFDTSWATAALQASPTWTGILRIERGRVYAPVVATAANGGLGGTSKVVIRPGGHYGMWEPGVTIGAGTSFEVEGTGYGETNYEAAIRMANGGATTQIDGLVTLTGNTTLAAGGTGIITQGIAESAVSNLAFGTNGMGGVVELRGTSTYTGTTTVAFGTLMIGSSAGASTGAIYSGNIGSQVTVNAGKTLRFGITSVPQNLNGTLGGTGNINVGGSATTAGVLNVVAGGVATLGQLVVGDAAIGSYIQTGGTVTTSDLGNVWIANNPGGSGSSLTLSGGTLSGGTGTSVIGVRGSYNFTISGTGEAIFGILQLGHTGGTNNNPAGRIVNLNGGALTLTTGIVYAGATNNSTAVFNLDGGTLRAGASAVNLWKHDAAVTATIGAGGLTLDSQAFTTGLTQTLGGTGNLTKVGSGTMTLAGVSAYTGTTTVAAGTLVIPETTASSALAVNHGATLLVTGSAGVTIGGTTPISSLTLGSTPGVGGGTIAFTNFTSNPGMPLVYASSVLVKAAAAGSTISLPGGTFTGLGVFPLVWYDDAAVGGDGFSALKLGTLPRGVTATLMDNAQSLDLDITGYTPLAWKGNDPSGLWDINTTANWQGVDTKYVDGDIVVLDNTATGTTNLVLDSTVTPTSVTASNADYTLTGTGTIAGAGGVTKSGTGSLTMGTNNTYSGSTAVNGGTLKLGHVNALGSTLTGTTVNTGGALDVNGIALAVEPVTLNGTGVATGGALLNSSATAATVSSPLTLASAASLGGSGNMTVSGDIAGAMALTKVGGGITSFNTRKSYSGNTIVDGGILNLAGGGGAGGTIRNVATVNAGGSLRLSTGDATGYSLGTDRLTAMQLIGGNLDVNTTANQTLGAAAITVQGGTLTGVAGSNLDFFTENNVDPLLRSSFTTLASSATSVVSGVKLNMRQENGLVFTIADGPAGIDLDVQSNISSTAFTDNKLVKAGPGTMWLSGLSSYAVPTMINAGALLVPSVQASPSFTLADGTMLSIAGAPGSSFATGTMIFGAGGATTLNLSNFGGQLLPANAPVKVTTALTFNGTASVNVSGYFPAPGTYPLIAYPATGYTGPVPVLGTLPRSYAATLVDNPTTLTFRSERWFAQPAHLEWRCEWQLGHQHQQLALQRRS